jgi:hypothetical protein
MVNTEFCDRRYHRNMSERPPSGSPAAYGAGGYPSAPAGFPGPPPLPPAASRGSSRGLTFLALALAIVASGLAIVGWFRPSPSPPPTQASTPTYTEQQISDAKTRACAAFEVVQKGATIQTNPSPTDDPGLANAQAAHAQLSLVAGGWYLSNHVDSATPASVRDEIRKLSGTMLDIGANALAGAKNSDPSQAALIEDANQGVDRIKELCK